MPCREAFVAEIAVDLVDALKPADDEPLQVQLRGDAQVHVQAECVVMGHEGPGSGAARNRLHHRRLDLDEVERVEKVAQEPDDPRARAEYVAAGLVDDEVDVAPAVAGLGVGKPMPLVGQRPQRLHEHADAVGAHGQLARLRLEQHASGANDVPDVPGLERLVGGTERVLLQEQLDLSGAVGDLHEARLAHHALEQNAPTDVHTCAIRVQPFRRPIAECSVKLRGERVAAVVVGKGVAGRAQLRQLGAPLRNELVLIARRLWGLRGPLRGQHVLRIFRICHCLTRSRGRL